MSVRTEGIHSRRLARGTARVVGLGLALASWSSCSDPPADAGGTDTETATGTVGSTGATVADSTAGTSTTAVADETATTGSPSDCWPSRRYALYDDDRCGVANVGDVDGDGRLDLVVLPLSSGFLVEPTWLPVHTYLGGTVELAPPEVHCCVELMPHRLSLIDLNGDGQADPVYATMHDGPGVGGTDEVIDTLLRGPLGGYVAASTVSVATNPTFDRHFAVGDFGVGTPAVVATVGREEVGVLVSDGLSLVSRGPTITIADYVRDLAAHDLDDDGTDEVLVLTNDELIALDTIAGGGLVAGSPVAIYADAMVIGDIDGDGAAELVLFENDSIRVLSLANASLESLHTLAIEVDGPATLLDGDQDGRLDLLVASEGTVALYPGTPGAGFGLEPQPFAVTDPDVRSMTRGDLDDDGVDELIVCDAQGVLVLDPP